VPIALGLGLGPAQLPCCGSGVTSSKSLQTEDGLAAYTDESGSPYTTES
jgi:hypothetical protein